MKKEFLVIGLARFGSSVCKELKKLGHEVLAVDIREEKVNAASAYISQAVIADASDEKTLRSLGAANFDYAVVAIGDNIQSSILCTLLLKEMGVKNVWVKAQNMYHQKVLQKIGADRIIQPEQEMGVRTAHQLDSGKLKEYIELSEAYSIQELEATSRVSGKSLIQLNVRANFGCTILAIKHNQEITVAPDAGKKIYEGDILTVIGHNDNLKRFEEKGL